MQHADFTPGRQRGALNFGGDIDDYIDRQSGIQR
jgi:hypothetical protein